MGDTLTFAGAERFPSDYGPHIENFFSESRLADEDEDIVIRAEDGLCTRGGEKEVVNRVVPLLAADTTSIRLRTLITELMIEQEWNVKVFKKRLADKIPEAYFVDATGVVRRK